MPSYQSPGVYVEEVASGARPLEGVGTAVAAFVGLAETGPFNAPTLVSNWTQFSALFGGFVPGSYLAQSVYGYFMNGGGNCYVVRIGQNLAAETNGSRNGRPKEVSAAPTAQIGRLKVDVLDPAATSGSVRVLSGVAADQPSWLTDKTMSAPSRGAASASTWCTGSPSQAALPARSPPTWLDMQVSVVRCSVSGRARSSA